MTNRPATEGLLPDDLLWADGGHASDVVLTALADGQQAIVPLQVRAHVDGCLACTKHLGNAALLSLHTGREVARARAIPERLPLPSLAIVLGLVVASLGLLPSLLDGGATTFATRDVPVLARAFGTLVRRLADERNAASLVVTYGASLLLVAMAFAVVRLLPKKEVS